MNKDDSTEIDDTAPLSEQASHWWVLLHSENVSAGERREFGAWVSRSPERIEAYLQTERLVRALKSTQVHWPEISTDALIREARVARAEVVPISGLSTVPRQRAVPSRVSRKIALVAAAATVAFIAVGWISLTKSRHYQTLPGEQRSIVMEDGSLITLNTASRIEVQLQQNRRLIRLFEGEALFQVAQDKARPFEVVIGDTTVRAIGTEFNVDRRAASTTVTVIEGKVLVDEVPLAAAERIIVTASKVSAPQHLTNLAPAVAWTQRRLIFEHRPLGEVAEEFNRYNRRHIQVASAELRNREITGVFQANDPDSFITFLSRISGVTVRKTEDGTRIEMAPALKN